MSLTPRLDRLDKNYLINGAFDLYQRGGVSGSVNVSGTLTYVGPDRWRTLFTGTHAFTPNVRRSTTVPDSSVRFSNRWDFQRSASAAILAQEQRIEAANCVELVEAGKLSISLFVNSTVVPVGTQIRLFLYTPIATDNHTSQNIMYSTTYSLSTANVWTEVKFEDITVTSAALLGLGVRLEFSYPSGTDGSAQSAFITKVMLNSGDTARTFTRYGKSFEQEVAAAQRYYEKTYPLDAAVGSATTNGQHFMYVTDIGAVTARAMLNIVFKVKKRTTPAMTYYNWRAAFGLNQISRYNTDDNQSHNGGVGTSNSSESGVTGYLDCTANISSSTTWGTHWAADAEL